MTYWDHHWSDWSSYPDPDDYGPGEWEPEPEWTSYDEMMLQEHFEAQLDEGEQTSKRKAYQ